jgi:glycosyltransferase involved in cell wall biosynthesis
MTFLFINTLYSPNHMGGAEISVQLLSEALVQQGHRVYVISLAAAPAVKRINGVVSIYLRAKNIYGIAPAKRRPAWQRFIWHCIDTCNPAYFFVFKKLFRRIRPDVVNTNNLQGFSLFTWYALRRLKFPVIHTMRDYYILCHRTTLFRCGQNCTTLCFSCQASFTVKKHFTQLPDVYIGLSHFIMAKHHEAGIAQHKPGYIIPNIVTLPVNGQELQRKEYTSSNIKIGFIGRVTAEKGTDYLFSEFGRLTGTNYTLLLAGAYEEAYKTTLLRYAPAGKVLFMDKMNAAAFYKSVDIVVVPSVWEEPFGRVVIEAMAWNRPVCIAAHAGLLDLYEPDCMWQFQMQPGSLSGLLEQVLQQPDDIAVKAAQCSRFTGKYSAATVAEQFIHVADSLKDKRQRV